MEDMPKEAQVILPELETLDFIRQGRNLVLYGNPGTGKTHIATGIRKMINRAYVVMVAIDENGRALPVPGLILESPEQEAEWEGGKRRYELRKERHREGF